MSVILPIERVLKSGNNPIREGLFLYEALVEAGSRVILTTETSRAQAEHWLMQQSIKGFAAVMDNTFDLGDGAPLWAQQIMASRAAGRVDLVVATSVETVSWCLDEGLVSILFAHPTKSSPDARPDHHRRTWEEITAQVEQKEVKQWAA